MKHKGPPCFTKSISQRAAHSLTETELASLETLHEEIVNHRLRENNKSKRAPERSSWQAAPH